MVLRRSRKTHNLGSNPRLGSIIDVIYYGYFVGSIPKYCVSNMACGAEYKIHDRFFLNCISFVDVYTIVTSTINRDVASSSLAANIN